MANDILISRFSSLNFTRNWKLSFQVDAPYVQRFASSDIITVQFAVPSGNDLQFAARVRNMAGIVRFIVPEKLETGLPGRDIYNVSVTGLPVGEYTFQIIHTPGDPVTVAQTDFSVSDDLEDTILISYTNRRNDMDTVFSEGLRFQFRVEGVFLPSEKSCLIESESFRDQRYTFRQLWAMPYTKETLTVGGGFGVPNWVAEKLNLIFTLSDVLIDGEVYVRSETSAPEITILHSDYPLFIYKIELEKNNVYSSRVAVHDVYPLMTADGEHIVLENGETVYG